MLEELKSKISNIYIMYLYAIISGDFKKCGHFLNDEMDEKLLNIIETNKANNELELFDELNVAKIDIISQNVVDNKEIVEAKILSRYMHYFIDKDTRNYKRGNNVEREEHINKLVFTKSLDKGKLPCNVKCRSCGANLEINFTGECPYCNELINVEDYEYIMTSLEID